MPKTIWGRKETIVWPYQIPVYVCSAVFFCAFLTFVFVCAWIRFGASPLERYYLPNYERTSVMSMFSKTHQSAYRVLFVAGGKLQPRPAMNDDVILGRTRDADGNTIPVALSAAARKHGYDLLFRAPLRSFVDARLRDFLKDVVYRKLSLLEFFRPPLIAGAVLFVVLLPFAGWKDVERQKQLRYGRRLKGPEMLTPRQFNRVVQGDGAGFKTDQMRKMLRIPARAEAQHIQIIGDTGAGKSALMFQLLRQVRSRGDSAIVYDPAREFVKRFYDPSRGDVILNPLDKRCPYWGPSDELRSRSEAKALAVSLFQPPQDKKGEFFIESPQKIFAFLMAYGPTPDELVEWMSNPEEIDRRLKGTEHAHLIDRHAHQQRAGVLGSLGLVADKEPGQQVVLAECAGSVPSDVREAINKADAGDLRSRRALALAYEQGAVGVERDEAEALYWYRAAAEQGSPTDQYLLGWKYSEGKLVSKNYAEAGRWYRKAAEQKNPRACVELGKLYEDGLGVGADGSEALRWYRMAADAPPPASSDLVNAEQAAKIFDTYLRAEAQCRIGNLFYEGKVGVKQDLAEAAKWFALAAKLEHREAQTALAAMYENGQGIGQDYSEALRLYRLAADQGYAAAQVLLGEMYRAGEGVSPDPSEAVNWYRKAAIQGDSAGQYFLGAMYENGLGVPKSQSEATDWYRKAAAQGDKDAKEALDRLGRF